MLSKFLSPQNDRAFKRIFGAERNKFLLIHFLNDMLDRSTNPIEDVTIIKTIQDAEINAQRSSILDVLCVDSKGNKFIVEMQVDREPGFEKRAQYYASRAYIEQREKGIEYCDLKEVIFLGITDFVLFEDKEEYLSYHVTLDKKTYDRNLKDFSFLFLELPKFKKTKEQLKTVIERWAYFFKHAKETKEEDLAMIVGPDLVIQQAYEALDRFRWSPEELRAYESSDMKRAADKAIAEAAKKEAEERGLQRGKQEGRQEGEAAMLLRQLHRKFGEIPATYRTKIEAADSELLLSWADRVLEVAQLKEVFEGS